MARGWEDSLSKAAAKAKSRSDASPADEGIILWILGRPCVKVPVLSNTTVSIWEASSKTSPPLISNPLQKKSVLMQVLSLLHGQIPFLAAGLIGTHHSTFFAAM